MTQTLDIQTIGRQAVDYHGCYEKEVCFDHLAPLGQCNPTFRLSEKQAQGHFQI